MEGLGEEEGHDWCCPAVVWAKAGEWAVKATEKGKEAIVFGGMGTENRGYRGWRRSMEGYWPRGSLYTCM